MITPCLRVFRKEADAQEFSHWIAKQPGTSRIRKYATADPKIPKRWVVKWHEEMGE
jgi:hypothetical protein